MSIKYKPTGCTKFLLVLIVLVPLAYFSAKLITGEDPMNNVYELLGRDPKEAPVHENTGSVTRSSDVMTSSNPNRQEIEKRIKELEKELEWLKEELKKQTN